MSTIAKAVTKRKFRPFRYRQRHLSSSRATKRNHSSVQTEGHLKRLTFGTLVRFCHWSNPSLASCSHWLINVKSCVLIKRRSLKRKVSSSWDTGGLLSSAEFLPRFSPPPHWLINVKACVQRVGPSSKRNVTSELSRWNLVAIGQVAASPHPR